MNNEQKAKSLWCHFCNEKSCDGHSNCELCPKAQIHPQLLEMAEWKDAQLREQEKRLLDVFEMVLNLSTRTQEGYDFAMTLFRNELINKDI